jgi:Protein of unknown function (DUF3617)
MKINISIILGLFLVCISVSPAKADGFKAGKWSMTMVTHMDSMSPEMAQAMQQMQNMPPQVQAMMQAHHVQMGANGQDMAITVTNCLTDQNPVPKYKNDAKMNSYCQQTHDFQGNTVHFHMNCNHSNFQMDSSGSMTYEGDSVHGHIKSHEVEDGQPMDSSITITGQYLGACDK